MLFATQSFTNSVQRANQTCRIILDENTNSPNINAENVVKEKLLKERNFGVLEGESYDIIPSIIEKNGEGFVPENGESGFSVQDRSRQFLKSILKFDEICEKNGKLSILIVSHGGWIRRTLGILFDEMNCTLPIEINKPNFKGGFKEVKFENTSYSKFDVSVGSDNAITMKCHELFNSAHLK